MPGPPVTIGCVVVLSPGAAGAPDTGTITFVPPGGPKASGKRLAMTGSTCTMTNSLSGATYPLPVGRVLSGQVKINGQPLVRVGDIIPSGPGTLTIIGPPAAPYIFDGTG